MLDIFTVSFFGHRIIENFFQLEKKLYNIIFDLIREKEYVDFLVGRNGDFDQLVSSAIKSVQHSIDSSNSSHICVLPYMTSEISHNIKDYQNYYDEIEVCELSCKAYPKAAITIRNRYMIDRSDLVIFYVKKKEGGAYQALRYAEKQNKTILNLFESI